MYGLAAAILRRLAATMLLIATFAMPARAEDDVRIQEEIWSTLR